MKSGNKDIEIEQVDKASDNESDLGVIFIAIHLWEHISKPVVILCLAFRTQRNVSKPI